MGSIIFHLDQCPISCQDSFIMTVTVKDVWYRDLSRLFTIYKICGFEYIDSFPSIVDCNRRNLVFSRKMHVYISNEDSEGVIECADHVPKLIGEYDLIIFPKTVKYKVY